MKLRIAALVIILSVHASAQKEERSEGISHLVPCAGLHDFQHSWDYDAKLRKILLNPLHERPKAFSLVRTGPGRPEYCVYLLETDGGAFTIETREASRHIWYDKESGENPVKVHRTSIPKEKGVEIATLWEKMLRGVRQPKPEDVTHVIVDGSSTHYACFVLGEGILAGETHNFAARGGDIGRMTDFTRWMYQKWFQDNPPEFTLGVDSTANKVAEQAGTGQPATRPESKSEGSDKPQPDAEGRSR
jgi:hypothetical protein